MTTEERPAEQPVTMQPHAQVPPPPPVSPFIEIQQQATRPISPRVIGILFFVGALVELSGLFGNDGEPRWLIITSIVDSLVFAIVLTVVGIGLVQYRVWAPRVSIISLVARFLTELPLLAYYIHVPPTATERQFFIIFFSIVYVLSLLYFATLIFFLTRPAVKAACDR